MKYIAPILSIVILLILPFTSTQADTSVWKISKNGDYFYLGGTIHILNKEDYPLPKAFNKAYQDADTLIFETDLDASNHPEQQAKMISAMTYHDGRTLSSELTPKTYKALEAFLLARQIPITHFEQYQPWGLSLVLTVMEYQRLGMISEFGVDNHFNNKAKADNKKIGSLETIDEQLGFLQSIAEIDPNITIEYTIKDVESLPQWIIKMKKAWRSGAIEDFSKMVPVKEMKDQFPNVYNTLIVKRNNNWMAQIPALMHNKQTELILVGTLHLNDKKGLLNQLKNQGFKIEHL